MLIRRGQMTEFDEDAREAFLSRVIADLRTKHSDRLTVSDSELRISAAGWIKDAQAWGFNTESSIIRYVNSCAETQSRREPIEVRLPIYLKLYHPELLAGVDLESFVPLVMRLASEQNIREDEGIAWLSVILLAGRQKGENDMSWVAAVLSQSTSSKEEARLLQVHKEAAARGWFIAPGDGQWARL